MGQGSVGQDRRGGAQGQKLQVTSTLPLSSVHEVTIGSLLSPHTSAHHWGSSWSALLGSLGISYASPMAMSSLPCGSWVNHLPTHPHTIHPPTHPSCNADMMVNRQKSLP